MPQITKPIVLDETVKQTNEALIEGLARIAEAVEQGGGGEREAAYVKITYDDLKELRDTNKLVPGTFYRIIDYKTIIYDRNAFSSEKPFDIIVQATDVNKLSENAKAVKTNLIAEMVDLNDFKFLFCQYADDPTLGDYAGGIFPDDNTGCITGFIKFENNKLYVDIEDGTYTDYYEFIELVDFEGETYGRWQKFDAADIDEESDYAYKIFFLTNAFVQDGKLYSLDSLNANFEAWDIKYCLDNDTKRFTFASAESEHKAFRYKDDMTYIHCRYEDGDEEGSYCWAYLNNSDNRELDDPELD